MSSLLTNGTKNTESLMKKTKGVISFSWLCGFAFRLDFLHCKAHDHTNWSAPVIQNRCGSAPVIEYRCAVGQPDSQTPEENIAGHSKSDILEPVNLSLFTGTSASYV